MRYRLRALNVDAALRPLRFVAMVAGLIIVFGYDMGVLLLNENYLAGFFIMNQGDLDVIMGTSALGMLLGYFLGGYLTFGSGRKICMLCGAVLGCISIVASFFAPSFSVMLCAQFVIGFSFGLYLLSAILYVSEITLPGNRGFAATLLAVGYLIGILLAVLTRGSIPATGGFLILFIVMLLNAMLLVMVIFKVPESPRYLAISGVPDAALPVLFRLRLDMGMAARELAGINECCRQAARGSELFLLNSNFRRLMWMLLCMALLSNLCGFAIIPYSLGDLVYASDLSMRYNYYEFTYGLIRASVVAGLAGCVTGMVAVDRAGRRRTLLWAMGLCALALAGMVCVARLEPRNATVLLSGFTLIYIFAEALIFPVFLTVLCAELIPTRAREFGLTLVLIFNTVVGMGCMQLFTPMVTAFDFSGLFTFCFVSSVALIALMYFTLPDSANASLEGIENRLLSGRPLTELGRVSDT
ncbi:MAG TPA: MFS transporter [Candidatus Avisuccinivibrio pullicola]|nr:MFS transporter [Candidatus Avisuccinivibrio pullicola]